jgi:dimethylargininase
VKALVRAPSPRLAEGLLTHIERRSVDYDLARRQWDAYVAALESVGWQPVEVDPAPDHPDSVFVEDAVVVHGRRAMVARPGALERRGEVAGVAAAVTELGLEAAAVEGPDTLDGGDVLKIGDRWYVGVGDRSTVGACEQLADHFGVDVVPVPITRALHLKIAVTALPDGTVIGYPPLVDDIAVFDRFLAVPEEPGSHVVVVDDDTVLMAASAPRTARMLHDRGLRTVEVDIGEFEKLEGCVTCLSVRVR